MNDELLALARAVGAAASKLPTSDALELLQAFLEFAGEAPEVINLRNAYVEIYAGQHQLQLFVHPSET